MTVANNALLRQHVEAVLLSALRLVDPPLGFLIDAIIAAEPNDTLHAEAFRQRPLQRAIEIVELAAALRRKALAYRSRLELQDIERQIASPDISEWPF